MNQELDKITAAPSVNLLEMTSQVVAAYLSNNRVSADQLPGLINAVHETLRNVEGGKPATPEQPAKPAVSIRKSVHPDYIVCLEDGKKLKMLKRHLRTTYNMSPEEYREKWNLPADYPMVAPNYAQQRSEFAKRIGLGRSARGTRRRKAS